MIMIIIIVLLSLLLILIQPAKESGLTRKYPRIISLSYLVLSLKVGLLARLQLLVDAAASGHLRLRTDGVNTNGAAAKVMIFDR